MTSTALEPSKALDELGPVDYLVVEFPAGASSFTGEMAKELLAASPLPSFLSSRFRFRFGAVWSFQNPRPGVRASGVPSAFSWRATSGKPLPALALIRL